MRIKKSKQISTLFILILIPYFCLYLSTGFSHGADEQPSTGQKNIRVGFYENAPKLFTKPDGKPGGIFPEILNYIASQENYHIEWVRGSWNECLSRLERGEIDMMPDVAFSLERSNRYGFTDEPVFVNWAVIYTALGIKVNSILDLEGLRVGVMRNSIHTTGNEGILKQTQNFQVNCQFIEFDSYAEVFQALHNGLVDAGVVNRLFGRISSRDYDILATTVMFNPRHIKIAFPLNSPFLSELKSRIDHYLKIANTNTDSPIKRIVSAFLRGEPFDWAYQQLDGNGQIYLTKEEQEWIRDHPIIQVGFDPEFAPFEFLNDNNQFSGFAADYVALLNRRLGINMKVDPNPNLKWNEVIDLSKNKNIDILPAIGFTLERTKFLRFTKPYIGFHRVIFSRVDAPFISGLEDLKDKTIAIQANTSHSGWLKENSSLPLTEYDSLVETLQAVSKGEADVLIGNLAACTYWIRQLHITNLKVSAPVSSSKRLLHFGVRRDWPILVSILNKGLSTIRAEEAEMIRTRWTAAGYNVGIPAEIMWRRIGLVIAGAILLITGFWAWSFILKKEIRGRKVAEQKLQKTQNQLEERVENRTHELATANKNIKKEMKEKIQLVKQLQQAHKMESIGTLAGGIAHDFNNIIYAITGYTELVMDEISADSQAHENLMQVLEGATRAKDMVQQILTFSRKSETQKKPIRVQSVIKDALKLLRPSIPSTIEIRLNIDNDCQPVLADLTQIHQMIINLATNAYQAMQEKGGLLELSLKEETVDSVDLSSDLYPGRYINFSLSDTGHGINETVISKIFDPYFSTKKPGEGTGMGLSVVHGIVKDHGGNIKVRSELGVGTTFDVYLPLIKTVVKDSDSLLAKPAETGTEHILIVDDEEEIVFMEKQALGRLGYQITSSTGSMEALDIFKAKPHDFDLVITDLTMPNMTGDRLASRLREIRPDIPLIICTGFGDMINETKLKSIGGCEIVIKPMMITEIAATIRKVIDAEGS